MSLKKILSDVFWHTGITALSRKLFQNKDLTVLMYHKVDREKFEEHIKYLKKYYTIVSEEEVVNYYYHGGKLAPNSVLITFDDGYLNNYTMAYPVLKKYNAPAIIFLTTGFIGKKKFPWYDEVTYIIEHTKKKTLELDGETFLLDKKGRRKILKKYYHYMITADEEEFSTLLKKLRNEAKVQLPENVGENEFMTWKQAKEMMPLISFGSHTINHPIVPNISQEQKEKELGNSKKEIQKKLGNTVKSFCFPNGDYSPQSTPILKKNNYKLSFTTRAGNNKKTDNPFRIKRTGINILDDKKAFSLKMSPFRRVFSLTKNKTHFKVIMLTNYYYPQIGGLTTSIAKLKNQLSKKNIPVKVFPFPHAFRKIEKKFNNPSLIHRIFVITYMLMAMNYFFSLKIKYKDVVLHSHSANFCARTALLGKKIGFKTVHTFRTDFTPEERALETPRPYLEEIDVLTSCSRKLAENSAKKFGLKKNIDVFYESVPLSKTIWKKKKIGKTLRVLYVGHLFEVKDPLLFIKGIESLRKNMPVQAEILGDGPLKETLQEYLKEKKIDYIKLRGTVKKETVQQRYEQSDVFVLTSKGEGFGNVILEAMSNNIPVVATAVGGIPEIIEDGKNGILITKRTGEAVAKGILQAVQHRDALTKKAFETIKEKFDVEKNSNKYINLYQRMTVKRRPMGELE